MMQAQGQVGGGQPQGQGQMGGQPGAPGGMGPPGMQGGQMGGQQPGQPGQPQQQVPQQPGGQAGQGAVWKTWHSDADYDQRRQLISHIFRLFTARPRTLRQEFKDKLPDFVKRLEEALYRTAATKEEYCNINTLEQRLQNVARRMISRPGQTGQQQMQMQTLLQGVTGQLAPQQPGQQQPGQQAAQQQGQQMPGMVGVNGQGNFQQGNFQQNQNMMMTQQGMQGQMGAQMGASQGMMGQGGMTSMGMGQGGYQQPQQMQAQGFQMNRASPSLPNNGMQQQQQQNGSFGMQQSNMGQISGGGMSMGAGNNGQMNGGQIGLLRGAATREGNWNQSDNSNMIQVGNNQMLQPGNRMTIGGNQMGGAYQQDPNSMGVQQQQMVQNPQAGMMRTPQTPNNAGMMNISPSMQGGQQQVLKTSQGMMINNQVQPGMGMSGMGGQQQMPQQGQPQQQNAMLLQQRQQQMLQQQRLQQQQQQGVQGGMVPSPNMGMQMPNQQPGMMQQQGMMKQSPVMPGQQPVQQQQQQPGAQGQAGSQLPANTTPQQVEALKKQQKWLLFLRHCIKCTAPQGQCKMWQQKCQHGKTLIEHIQGCKSDDCKVAQCGASKKLLKHHQKCQNPKCLVCGPVNRFVAEQRLLSQQPGMPQQQQQQVPGMQQQQQPNAQMQQMQQMQQPGQQMNPQMQAQQAQRQMEMQKQMMMQQQQQRQLQMQQQQQMPQQQHLQGALRGQASQELKSGMMETPGMMPTPGRPMQQASPGMSMPTPGLMGQQSGGQMQGGMMPNPGAMNMQGGVNMQQNNILRGSANMQGQGMMRQQGGPGSAMMIPNNPSGMIPTPQGSGNMMVQNNPGMMPNPNASSMMPVPGMMPNPGMGGVQMNQGGMMPMAKRQKIEPMPQAVAANVKMEVKPDPRAGAMLSSQHNHARPDAKASTAGQPTSLVETFTKEQIATYLAKVKEETAQENARASKTTKKVDDKHPPPPTDETPCRVCHNVRKSFFEPPVLFCFKCDKKIKENLVYYHAQVKSDPHLGNGQPKDFYWCHGCFQEVSKDKRECINIDGEDVPKNTILKKKNDDIQEEGWVQCDSCDAWVHQICGLFNRLLNDEQNTHYVCPECLLKGLENGKRKPVAQRPASMLTAKDLPATKLSAFLEGHLNKVLAIERADRAKLTNKPLEETPAVEGLTVRVVNNVVKKCETKPHFYETFKEKNYPQEFTYRQKVILLFQTMDGVDLCLYCMYTQEYVDDNPMPNRRVSYLSYLDSVKYMKPEGITAAGRGVALRTYVYHELLIGYLDYLRQRGFHQMFIWACPPSQGDDYILYAHPKTQKNPALPKLREWYFKMLRKAFENNIVTRVSNLYDTYFDGGRDHRIEKCSAVHLPYFEGDYWPGVAEVMLKTIDEEKKAAASGNKKAQTKKGSTSRSKITKGKIAGAGGATTDEQLMTKLGEAISGQACNKEDLMVVHLQHVCSLCRCCIHNGLRYYSDSPFSGPERKFEGIKLDSSTANGGMSGFELCENCYQSEIARSMAQGGPSNTRNRSLPGGISVHDLKSEMVPALPANIDEWDPDMECEIFNTRQQFLSLCQGNHYQFDTTRRTRHSSMMVLYHLHNPSAPAFAGTCNVCQAEIEPGDGFRCGTCDDFDMCKNCHNRGVQHEHPLQRQTATNSASAAERKRAVQVQVHQTLELLKHSSVCLNPACPEHKCNTMKKVIEHMKAIAQLREPHDCKHCKQMAKILKYHASFCKNNNCTVYMCRDLKDAMRRVAQRQEQQRAVAYRNMLAEQQRRAAEAGGSAP